MTEQLSTQILYFSFLASALVVISLMLFTVLPRRNKLTEEDQEGTGMTDSISLLQQVLDEAGMINRELDKQLTETRSVQMIQQGNNTATIREKEKKLPGRKAFDQKVLKQEELSSNLPAQGL